MDLCTDVRLLLSNIPSLSWRISATITLVLLQTHSVLCAAHVSGRVTRQPLIHCLKCQPGLQGWILWWRQWFLTGKLWQARQWTACRIAQRGGVEICCSWAVWGHIATADGNSQLGACRHNMWREVREARTVNLLCLTRRMVCSKRLNGSNGCVFMQRDKKKNSAVLVVLVFDYCKGFL